MPDTRSRPRTGAMRVMQERPSSLFYDSWAVCPKRGCGGNERDGTAWFNDAKDEYGCRDGHRWSWRFGLWEVESR